MCVRIRCLTVLKWPNGTHMLQFNCTVHLQWINVNNNEHTNDDDTLSRLCSPFSTNKNTCIRFFIYCYGHHHYYYCCSDSGGGGIYQLPKTEHTSEHISNQQWQLTAQMKRIAWRTHSRLAHAVVDFLLLSSLLFTLPYSQCNSIHFRSHMYTFHVRRMRFVHCFNHLINGWKKVSSHVLWYVIFITYRPTNHRPINALCVWFNEEAQITVLMT